MVVPTPTNNEVDRNCDKCMEMKLIDVVGELASFDSENTIYASEPWTRDCEAIVAPESAMPPVTLERLKMKYFLEVLIARDFLEDSIGQRRAVSDFAGKLCEIDSLRDLRRLTVNQRNENLTPVENLHDHCSRPNVRPHHDLFLGTDCPWVGMEERGSSLSCAIVMLG